VYGVLESARETLLTNYAGKSHRKATAVGLYGVLELASGALVDKLVGGLGLEASSDWEAMV